ncbi:MAG: AzlD domain-containing protein [Pseudomonadota bacterium]
MSSVWWIIGALGLGTYMTRFIFLGIVGDRAMPDWVLRHLRYTGVAVLPGLVAPLLAWPEGGADPARLAAAFVTIAVGVWRRDVIAAVFAGGAIFIALTWLT